MKLSAFIFAILCLFGCDSSSPPVKTEYICSKDGYLISRKIIQATDFALVYNRDGDQVSCDYEASREGPLNKRFSDVK